MDGIFGGNGANGTVSALGKDGQPVVQLLSRDTEAIIGAGQIARPARLSMYDGKGANTVNLTTADAHLTLGGGNVNGKLSVLEKDGSPLLELIAQDGEAVIGAGRKSHPARLTMYDGKDGETVNLKAADAHLALGGSNVNGKASVLGKDGSPVVEMIAVDNEAVIGLGQKGRPGRISLYNTNQQEAVRIDTQGGGDIWIANGDVAEEFDLGNSDLRAGMVAVLSEAGTIAPCEQDYDSRVVGVIAGAGDYRPAIVLDRQQADGRRAPVALLGKVHCWVDANQQQVKVGDLLTTSARYGHARAVADRALATGAVIGKALAPLASGCALIPVLVTLH